MSAIMTMSADGPHYTLIHIGANDNQASFDSYFSHLIASITNEYASFTWIMRPFITRNP